MDRQDQEQWWDDFNEVDAFWRLFFQVGVSQQDIQESAVDVPF
jgi:hypothetical protein